MTLHILPWTAYVYHAASGDADCRFSKYCLHCRFLGKDFDFFVRVRVAQRTLKQISPDLNRLCEYRVCVCVSETSGSILKKFSVWATYFLSEFNFWRTGPIVACALHDI